jgi:ring-1,2-phenylacetyl-CoA epoxidase subunit PaaC
VRFEYVLGLGDDALVEAQRLAEWCAAAPEMEEDVALANIALDQLGAARLLLSYAGELEGAGRDEDALAYLRGDREFRNCLLVELPDRGDFGLAIAKLLFLSAYQRLLYDTLAGGAAGVTGPAGGGAGVTGPAGAGAGGERLAAIAATARKESAYHLDHAAQWTIRLGDGTDESHRRMQAAVDELWPYTHELFGADELAEAAVDPASLRPAWLSAVEPVLAEATLQRPEDGWAPGGGRHGRHTEHLSYLLAEMQVLHRAHQGAVW